MHVTAARSLRAVALAALALVAACGDGPTATGTATLVVKDAVGTQVYSGDLTSSGQPLSAPAGVAGAWTIKLTYTTYSNTQVNFAVLKQ